MSFKKALEGCSKIRYCFHNIDFNTITHLKKIVIVRNPVDRFTSAFYYTNVYRDKTRPFIYQTPEKLIQDLIICKEDAYRYMKVQKHYHTVNRLKIGTDYTFHPQIDWIIDPYKIMLYDNLDQETEELGKELQYNIQLPHINKTNQTCEYSKESIDFLKCYYREDFELYDSIKQKHKAKESK